MPSRIFNDPDFKLFTQALQHLPLGKSYREAWRELLGIQRRLSLLYAYPNAFSDAEMIMLRRDYVKQLRRCDELLNELDKKHHWPPH